MSTDFNNDPWGDWSHSDWGNGWTDNSAPQNFSRQPPPKEQGNQNNRQNKVCQPASGQFDNKIYEDQWIINQPHIAQNQTSSYSLEAANNNTINQIENREVAPPDNKHSFDASQIFQNRQEPHQNRPNQLLSNTSQSLKQQYPPLQHSTFQNNVDTFYVSNYFEPKPVSQITSAPQSKPFNSQPIDSFLNQPVASFGPSSYGGVFSLQQQQLDNETQFSSLGHPPPQPQQQFTHAAVKSQNSPHQPPFVPQNIIAHQQPLNSPSERTEHGTEVQQHTSNINLGIQRQTSEHLINAQQHPSNAITGPSNIPHPSSSSSSVQQNAPSQQNFSNPSLGSQLVNAEHNLPTPPLESQLTSVQQHFNISPSLIQHSGPQQQSLNSLFGAQTTGEHQSTPSNVPVVPQTVGSQQHSSSPPLGPHATTSLQQPSPNISAGSQPLSLQQLSSNTPSGPNTVSTHLHANEEVTIQTQQNIENAFRFSPSPHQQMFRSPTSQSHPPHSTNTPQFQVNLNSEIQESNVPVSLNANQPSFQISKMNFHPPMATSSPVVNNTQYPENQERIPDNKEYPDNTENIAHQLQGLNLNPSREVEQEAQKHCAIDRNQYLETGQFSAQKENNGFIQNFEVNDEGDAPPPGLHRLVTGQGCEPWKIDPETTPHPSQTGDSTPGPGTTRHSSPLSSIGGESGEGREGDKDRRREVPGEAEPLQGRVVLGQVPTPPQDALSNRGDRERKRLERRMVEGEHGQSGGNNSDDYRQPGRPSRHSRHRRNDSSYEDEEHDYSSDRDRRNEEYHPRDERTRRRREHRSPECRSDEEYENRRGYHRNGRERPSRHYYPRDYDDGYYRENQRSRPSSRSGSDYRHPLKHSMRVLPGHHYYNDPYASTTSFHEYNMKYSQRTLEYFDRMRHDNPAAYAAWYSQYMQGRFMQESAREFSSDRASVHSGQSSSNQRHGGIATPQENVDDLTREEDEADYMPRLYDCAHIRGTMDGHGRLIVVEPNYPLDHQKATVNICRLPQVSLDKDSEDFFQSPGPFIPGITHRNTVLQYLKRISDRATKSSEKLLYDLVHMTVKGNGDVNGSDVAELLMESYKRSLQEEREESEERENSVTSKEVTTRFRELLQQGNKSEALEWAMENGAWGHALFLASKMGERTHNDIMLRFANSIPHNDTLQTLYQLMSGYIPQSATCCADKKWSDWRPHLAMILSNPTGSSNVDRQAIITLGDSLNASGRLFASHFCYVTAQVEFSEYRSDAKLVLLGSSHNQEFSHFATCRAIMLTMCYEYGLKLRQPTFSIPTLQVYKLILAGRLIDSGRMRNSLQYCELLAQETLANPSLVEKSVIATVIDFSSRLKMLDPAVALTGNIDNDPDWLSNLKQLYDTLPNEYESSKSHSASPPLLSQASDELARQDLSYQQIADTQPNSFIDSGPGSIPGGVLTYPKHNQNSTNNVTMYQPLVQHPSLTGGPTYQPPSNSQLPPRSQPDLPEDVYHHQGFIATPMSQSQHNSLGYQPTQIPENVHSRPGNIEMNSGPESSWEPRLQPQIIHQSSDSSQQSRNNFFKATEEQLKLNEVGGEKRKDVKQQEQKAPSKSDEQSTGWFGGIWEKINPRPKNQMRLPDDSNPSIIWDEKKKRWVNLDGDNESSASVKPPPKINEALPPQGNKYKIQKGKLMKSNYVDVMGNKEKDSAQTNFMPTSALPPVKTNFFIPPPVEGNENAPIDFITPAPLVPVIGDTSDHNKPQLSRSSSVSSLSREVQFYMAPPQGYSQPPRVHGNQPMMYNSSRYPS